LSALSSVGFCLNVRSIWRHGLEHLQHDCRDRGLDSGTADLQRGNPFVRSRWQYRQAACRLLSSPYWLRARGGRAGPTASTSSPPTSDEGAGVEDWAGYWTNCRRVGWATWPIPGSVLAKISRCRIIQLGPALGPDIIKTLAQRSGLSEEELTKQSVAGSAGGRRQADPRWPTADVSGVI
jgi:hypothetical protein